MKNLIYILSILLLIISCNSDDDSFLIEESESFSFQNNLNIESTVDSIFDLTFDSFNITEGENVVFCYTLFRSFDTRYVKEGGDPFLIFEIDKYLEEFSFMNEELLELSVYYVSNGQAFMEPVKISEGIIMGNKIDDDSWNISINITVPTDGGKNLIIDSTFTRETDFDKNLF